MNAASTALLEARGLGLTVPLRGAGRDSGRVLLQALDLRVQAGERWCVLGRNAVGKSTLLRALAGLSVPQVQGELCWAGQPMRQWSPEQAARLRAYQPQTPGDRFGLSVRRLLELAVCVPGRDDPAAVLAAVDAADLIDRDVRRLSGGERQRVALAQCALQGAPLLLLDEPVSFQDPAHQQQVGRWLVGWTGAGARAVVMTAHDVNWVARVATHVLLLLGQDAGAWLAGPAADMLTAPRLQAVYGCAWQSVGGVWVPAV